MQKIKGGTSLQIKKIVGGRLNKKVSRAEEATQLSEPGFDPGTCGLWAHHASAAPL